MNIDVTGPGQYTVSGLHDGEPIFVLRAQDSIAIPAMSLWREMAWQMLEPQRLAELDADVNAFITWARANRDLLKLPD